MPRVSVLMPLKDAVAYVSQALTSILTQDFVDLEVIVTDDGSRDGSREVVDKIRDSRVRVLDGPRRGVAAAWNTAFQVATGDIVMQCDADDLYPVGRISRQVILLDARPEYGAVCASFSTIDPAGRLLADFHDPTQPACEITDELLMGQTRTHLCTFAIRRAALLAVAGKREYFESAEDIDLQLRLAEACRIWFEPEMAYRYRIHGRSLTHNQISTRRQFFEEYARELRTQRAVPQGRDDLQRGVAREPPIDDSKPDMASKQAQGFLLSEAWRVHARGARLSAIKLGIRAVAQGPGHLKAWRSLAALALKPSRASTRP
jgi:glycosyltransferase involved in cell wall biosynthesis